MVAIRALAASLDIAGEGCGDVAPAPEMTSCEERKARTAKRMMDNSEEARGRRRRRERATGDKTGAPSRAAWRAVDGVGG